MSNKSRHFLQFGPYRLDPDRRLLQRENKAVPVQPKAFDILLVLCENSEKVVPKEELLNKVWPDTFVEESNLVQNIFVLRSRLRTTEAIRRRSGCEREGEERDHAGLHQPTAVRSRYTDRRSRRFTAPTPAARVRGE